MAPVRIIIEKSSLNSSGLRKETAIAFGLILMSFLVFLGYLFPGVSSYFESRNALQIIVPIIFLILFLGFVIISKIVGPIVKISHEAKKIADGDLDRELELYREDEIGELGRAINRMMLRMKENVEELQKFSKTTETIDAEINRRIFILSHMLQVSNLITQNASLKEIVAEGVSQCLSSGVMNFACLILKDYDKNEYQIHYLGGEKAARHSDSGAKNLKLRLGEGLLGKVLLRQATVVIDSSTPHSQEIEEFQRSLLLRNAIVIPVSSKGNAYGLLITGNDAPDFVFPKAEQELLQLTARQIAIANANYILQREIEKLEVTDKLTGLYNHTFVHNRLQEEIKRSASFQRPCSFVLFRIVQFDEFHKLHGHIAAENVLIKIGMVLKEATSGADKAARFSDHEFSLILPEKSKRQAIAVANGIRAKVEELFAKETEPSRKLTFMGAVTENPLDGVTADDLIHKAQDVLAEAEKAGGSSRICYKL